MPPPRRRREGYRTRSGEAPDGIIPPDVGWLSDHLGSLQAALLITSPTLLILAAIIAATGLRSVKPDTQAMEDEWAERPPAQATGVAGWIVPSR
jgi:hypothetical protein